MTNRSSGDAKLLTTFDLGQCAPTSWSVTRIRWARTTSRPCPCSSPSTADAADGTWSYWTQSPTFPPSTDWTLATWRTPKVPSTVGTLSFGLTIDSNGTLSTSDSALVDQGSGVPPAAPVGVNTLANPLLQTPTAAARTRPVGAPRASGPTPPTSRGVRPVGRPVRQEYDQHDELDVGRRQAHHDVRQRQLRTDRHGRARVQPRRLLRVERSGIHHALQPGHDRHLGILDPKPTVPRDQHLDPGHVPVARRAGEHQRRELRHDHCRRREPLDLELQPDRHRPARGAGPASHHLHRTPAPAASAAPPPSPPPAADPATRSCSRSTPPPTPACAPCPAPPSATPRSGTA